jgi:catalase
LKSEKWKLNRNPENYFADVEQAAFNPSHVVPGIGLSPDKLLQGRLFAYGDAQRYRLGVNSDQIPVNQAHCPVHSYHRDGLMRVDGNYGGTKGYTPNSYHVWDAQPEAKEPALALNGAMDRHNPYEDRTDDCFYQPGDLYRLMTEDKKALLISNTCADIMPVTENIKYRHAAHCYLADKDYGTRIANGLHLDMKKVEELAAMTEAERLEATASVHE